MKLKPKKKSVLLFATLLAFWVGPLLWLNFSPVREFIQYRFANVFQYQIRDFLGLTPKVDPSVRIFALDDIAFSFLGGPKPGIEDWAKLLTNIAKREPKAIIIDALFSVSKPEPDEQKYIETLRQLPVPVYTGVSINPRKIRNRHNVPLIRPNHDLKRYTEDARLRPEDLSYLLPRDGWFVLGHAQKFDNVFYGQGHILYNKTDWTIPLFFRMGPDKVLPHLAIGVADDVKFRRDGLYINNKLVPLDANANATIDHRPPLLFYKNTKSLFYPLQRAYAGQDETSVKKGDIVLILDTFATGNTDFHEGGPFGEIPGGFVQAAAIDTILHHRWINKYETDTVLLVLFLCAGVLCGYFAGPVRYWFLTVVGLVGYSAWVTYMFAYQSTIVPWVLPLAGFFGSGAIINSYRFLQSQLDKVIVEKNLLEEKAMRLEEEKQKVALQESLALGKAVQDLLMSSYQDGNFSGFRYETKYSPSQVMSGDWVYVWDVSETEKRIFLGDVMGKGPSAAIPVAVIIGTLKECEVSKASTPETFQRINARLHDLFSGQITSTVSAIVLKEGRGFELFNAGGPGWFIGRAGKVEFLPLRSAPLGIFDNPKIVSHELARENVALLFAFTDGYLEGARALKKVAKYYNEISGPSTIEELHAVLLRAGEGARLEDDKTLLTVRAA
jgi:hypothetical protein